MVKLLTLVVLVLSVLVAPAFTGSGTFTILHTNDMHASFIPHEALWVKGSPKPMVGGFKELFFIVDSIRHARKATLLLDAGDVMTGNPITEREYEGAMGGALFKMMDMIGYDAWAPGNHDFDVSQENLIRLTHIAEFPTVSANLVNVQGAYPVGNKPYVILTVGGLKVGIVGLISQDLYGLVNQNNLVGIKVLSPVETLQKYADELAQRTDIVVALTHQGVEDDSVMAVNLRGVGIIVGGHSHTRLRKPKVVNNVVIVQTGSNCENLGELEVTVENHRVVKFDGKLIPLWVRPERPSNALSGLVDSMQAAIDKDYSEVIGTLDGDWIRGNGASAIGSFVSEAQRLAAHADVAFMNTHGIRKDLLRGPMTKRDLFEVLPFRNILTTFQLSGNQLLGVLHYYLEHRSGIQIAGLTCTWSMNPDSSVTLADVRVQGKLIENDRMYVCAASDFFVGEARHYIGMELPQVTFLKETLFEAVEHAVKSEKQITPKILYRIDKNK